MSKARRLGSEGSLRKARFPLLLSILVAFLFARAVMSQDAASPRVSLPSSLELIYSPDPNDSWNRVFYCLFSRRMEVRFSDEFPEGAPFKIEGIHQNLARFIHGISAGTFERTEIGDRAIDPLYPASLDGSEVRIVLVEPVYSEFRKALQDALVDKEHVPRSAVARALMQSDLWSAYDIFFRTFVRANEPELAERRRVVVDLLGQLIRKVALPSKEIESLPGNYFPAMRGQSLPDLFHKEGGWIEVQWFQTRQHDGEAGYRRVSRIFLKPTHPPRDMQAFLDTRPGRGAEDLDAVALVMQLLLIDTDGNLRRTSLTTDVQVRRFEKTSDGVFKKTKIQVCEISRKLFVRDGDASGLVEEQENSSAYFGNYNFAANYFPNAAGQFHAGPPVQIKLRTRCSLCHEDSDLKKVITFAIVQPPHPPRVKELKLEDNEEAAYDIDLKTKQKDFQSLRAYFH